MLAFLCVALAFTPGVKYSAVLKNNAWSVEKGGHGVAWAIFDDSRFQSTGWYTLNVVTSNAESDSNQAYGAGFVEGALTYKQTFDNFRNRNVARFRACSRAFAAL